MTAQKYCVGGEVSLDCIPTFRDGGRWNDGPPHRHSGRALAFSYDLQEENSEKKLLAATAVPVVFLLYVTVDDALRPFHN